MAQKSYQEQLIDEAQALEEEYRNLLDRRKANRELLRNMLTAGHLDPEQAAYVEETYPARTRTTKDGEE